MHRSYRDNRQRFHKGRQGSILVPHGALSGLLFTINPRQDQRALREAQLYLHSLHEDLQAAHKAYLAAQEGETAKDDAADDDTTATPECPAPVASTSSLLAAELAEAMRDAPGGGGDGLRRKRQRNGSDDEDDSDASDAEGEGKKRKGPRPSLSQKWFASLETSCKGYMLLNVPAINPAATCVVARAGGGEPQADTAAEGAGAEAVEKTEPSAEGEEASTTATTTALPPHSIVINPLVSHVTERVFADMMGKHAKPTFRHCFRLMPVELTCCPTLNEMIAGLRSLLKLHFPAPDNSPEGANTEQEQQQHLRGGKWSPTCFDGAIPLAPAASVSPQTQKPKHMHTVVLSINVKNNSNVDAKKAQVQSQLQAAIPMNRFIVVPHTKLQHPGVNIDAVICVNVIHATCAMGVQRLYRERRSYNLHDLSEATLELSDSVVTTAAATKVAHAGEPAH